MPNTCLVEFGNGKLLYSDHFSFRHEVMENDNLWEETYFFFFEWSQKQEITAPCMPPALESVVAYKPRIFLTQVTIPKSGCPAPSCTMDQVLIKVVARWAKQV